MLDATKPTTVWSQNVAIS